MTHKELDASKKCELQIDLKRYMSYGWSLRIMRGMVRMSYGVDMSTKEIKDIIKEITS